MSTAPFKQNKKSKLRSEYDEEKTNIIGQLEEEMDVVGQESEEKAAKWVTEIEKGREADEKKEADEIAEYFEKKSKGKIKSYNEELAKLLYHVMQVVVDVPKGWKYRVFYDDKKVGIRTWHYIYGEYGRGFKPCGEQKYDINAINTLIMQIENTYEEFVPRVESPIDEKQNGVIIPDEVDHEQIKRGVGRPDSTASKKGKTSRSKKVS